MSNEDSGDGGRGGDGGAGGPGGSGGNGGTVTFSIVKPDSEFKPYATVVTAGGAAGLAGDGGRGGAGGSGNNNGQGGATGHSPDHTFLCAVCMADNTYLGVGTDNQLYQWVPDQSRWDLVPNGGLLRSIATVAMEARPDNVTDWPTLVGIGTDYQMYQRIGLEYPWQLKPMTEGGSLRAIARDDSAQRGARLWAVNTSNELLFQPGSDPFWRQIDVHRPLIGLTIHSGKLFGVGTDYSIYTRNIEGFFDGDRTLTSVPNSGAVTSITTREDGAFVGIGTDRRIYLRNSLESDWIRFSDTSSPPGASGTFAGVQTITASVFAAAASPDQVAMTLASLRFAYLAQFSLNSFSTDSDDDKARTAAFKSTIDWLNQLVPLVADQKEWKPILLILNDLTLKVNNRLDFYGNRFDMVPRLNPDISSIKEQLVSFSKTEEWYRLLAEAVANYDQKKSDVQTNYDNLRSRIEADDTAKKQAIVTLANIRDEIIGAETNVRDKLTVLRKDFSAVIDKIAKSVSWNGDGLLGALSSCLMFAGPEFSLESTAGKQFAAGGALSVASNFNFDKIDTAEGAIDKRLLIAQTKSIEASLSGLQAGWTSSEGGLLNANGNNTLFLTQKDDADKFLTQYFPDDSDIRTAVDDYIDAIQAQNRLVLRYNKYVTQLLKAEADEIQANEAKAIQGASLESLDSPGLMQLSRLASLAYESELHDILEQIYTAGRAYSCLALRPSACMSRLASLDGMSDVTSDAVSSALDVLVQELKEFDAELTEHPPTDVPLTLRATATGPAKPIIDAFKHARKVSLFIDPDPTAVLLDGTHDLVGKYNVRVTDVKAYLIGVGSPNQNIQVNITRGGRCQVTPYLDSQSVRWFDMNESTMANVFSVSHDGQVSDVSNTDSVVAMLDMRWGGNNGTRAFSAPLVSLFTEWTMSVPDPTLDLSKLNEIRLVFGVSFRAK